MLGFSLRRRLDAYTWRINVNQKEKDLVLSTVEARVRAVKAAIVGDVVPTNTDEAVFELRTAQATLGCAVQENIEALISAELIEKERGEKLLKAQKLINVVLARGLNDQIARDGYEK